jgi:tetratricopeptide (TPR) repeat protein
MIKPIPENIEKFNALYENGCKKIKDIIILEKYKPKAINFFEKTKIKKAIACFEQALLIYPEHWQSLFFLGKIYQRLQNYDRALSYFENAVQLERLDHNIFSEASITAMHLKNTNKGIEYSSEALKRKPNDFALLGNHSMNLLIGGKNKEAIETIDKAIVIKPDDQINQKIKAQIIRVINGNMAPPTFEDFFK